MLVQVDITANVNSYVGDRRASARYASFDYCYNHFQGARERGELEALADGDPAWLKFVRTLGDRGDGGAEVVG